MMAQISIHAPREGRDGQGAKANGIGYAEISIHAPREGRDCTLIVILKLCPVFQSTRPARGATAEIGSRPVFDKTISIHAPREGRDDAAACRAPNHQAISIHAPREGRDRISPEV